MHALIPRAKAFQSLFMTPRLFSGSESESSYLLTERVATRQAAEKPNSEHRPTLRVVVHETRISLASAGRAYMMYTRRPNAVYYVLEARSGAKPWCP